MQRVLSAAAANPSQIPKTFMPYVIDSIQTQRLTIPIGQITGFSNFTIQGRIDNFTPTSITSTTPADPPTGAYILDGLPQGKYFFLYGAFLMMPSGGQGNNTIVELLINGAYPFGLLPTYDSHAEFDIFWNGSAVLTQQTAMNVSGFAIGDLQNPGDNYVRLLANITNPPPTWSESEIGKQWIFALKYANL